MYYPTMIDLSCFNIVIIGGGKIAYQKAKELLRYGGKIKVISPRISLLFDGLDQSFEYVSAVYSKEALDSATLVIAATDDISINDEIGRYCREKHILCNVVTDQALSSFIVPASIRRGSLVLSVSTEGKSPTLAKRIREKLEEDYGEEYETYVELLGEAREKIKAEVKDVRLRKEALNQLINLSEDDLKEFLDQ